MDVSMNSRLQNPSFGYFNFSKEATQYFKMNLKPDQLDKFKKIINEENANKVVEASIYYNDGLHGHLRVFKDGALLSDFCKNLGYQGFFSKLFKGSLGYLEEVSKASTDMYNKYNQSQKVDSFIKEIEEVIENSGK